MTLSDDDYIYLATQCATQDWGRIDHDGGMVYVSMYTHVEYDQHELSLTGGHIPVYADCNVIYVDFDTADGSEVEVDTGRIEEEVFNILMQK
jgi:hypothetical protein